MLESGTIDESQHQKGIMAVLTGNETLMQHVLATPKIVAEKPNISDAGELEIIRQPFAERRKGAEIQLTQLQKTINESDLSKMPEKAAAFKTQEQALKDRIEQLFKEETIAVNKWRTEGRGKPAASAPQQGRGTMTFTPEISASEENILRLGRAMAGPESGKIGGDRPATRTMGPEIVPAPPREQRVVGQTYLLPDGRTAVWTERNTWMVQ
jgi:hypothetical protein